MLCLQNKRNATHVQTETMLQHPHNHNIVIPAFQDTTAQTVKLYNVPQAPTQQEAQVLVLHAPTVRHQVQVQVPA